MGMENKNLIARELTLIIRGLNVCHFEKYLTSACTLIVLDKWKFPMYSCENAHVFMAVFVHMFSYLYMVKSPVTCRHMNEHVNILCSTSDAHTHWIVDCITQAHVYYQHSYVISRSLMRII